MSPDSSSAGTNLTPTVFVSYSHDSPEHRRWVLDFASFLVTRGINVRLDQWDVGPGADLAKYMVQSIAKSDRVLLICTEKYVQKVNDGVGGVGYEAMVVSGALMSDLGTAKFIPVVRQDGEAKLPHALSSRFYVDFSEGRDRGGAFDILLRELHRAPVAVKPPIGANPYAVTPSGHVAISPGETDGHSDAQAISNEKVPQKIFEHAANIIRAGDTLQWRKAVATARATAAVQLSDWIQLHNGKTPSGQEELLRETMAGVRSFEGQFALMLAAIASGKPEFGNQGGLLEDILHPAGWNHSGLVIRTEMPIAAAFLYQAIHGAMAIHVRKLTYAIQLARHEVRLLGERQALPLWQHPTIVGWSDSLGRDSRQVWSVLAELGEHLPWVCEIFGGPEEWQTAVTAYYIALNINEFASKVASSPVEPEAFTVERLSVPLSFSVMPDHIKRRALSLLQEDPESINWIFSSIGLNKIKAREHWGQWVALCNAWISRVNPFAFSGIPHTNIL
ncbi:toll/interleukin-1 receptor domain-containing protein [Burkholderia gladioli]|uniref:toll/interleukin-1 receptor domain-containing protein n=1 Tax=Burkholderia gladioli TaxID=28095 RepID=UPI001C211960|nr:toll/interleukin-1 receptor domain-containing protein [Burkholderia gladioli]MBU9198847.1 toll/interleukin-1 receptor domain-containing protein [Burkholderia gladioli]